jgi:hypothetical protein
MGDDFARLNIAALLGFAYREVGKGRGHYGLLSSRGISTSLCKSRTRKLHYSFGPIYGSARIF